MVGSDPLTSGLDLEFGLVSHFTGLKSKAFRKRGRIAGDLIGRRGVPTNGWWPQSLRPGVRVYAVERLGKDPQVRIQKHARLLGGAWRLTVVAEIG